MLTVVIINFDF